MRSFVRAQDIHQASPRTVPVPPSPSSPRNVADSFIGWPDSQPLKANSAPPAPNKRKAEDELVPPHRETLPSVGDGEAAEGPRAALSVDSYLSSAWKWWRRR